MLKRNMFIPVIWILVLVFCSCPAFAQYPVWSRAYGGVGTDGGWWSSVQQTMDGGYILVGTTESFGAGNEDIYLIKTDSSGNPIWSHTYGGSDFDRAYSVWQITDGGYIVAGWTTSFGAGFWDVYLIKTDSLGSIVWSRTYGGTATADGGYSVHQTSDGGYIVVGITQSFGAGLEDIYLIRTDSSGDTLWTRTYGGESQDYGFSVRQTSEGGYIVVGQTLSFGAGEWDIYLIKTGSTGDTLWTHTYGGSLWEYGWTVQETKDQGFIIGGTRYTVGGVDVYLIKVDSPGDTLWSRTYGSVTMDHGYSVQQTMDGGHIIVGETQSGADMSDVYLIKIDSVGNNLWSRVYGGSYNDWGSSVQQIADGGYIVAGWTESFGVSGDVMLTKLDSLGNTCIGEFVSSTVMSVSCTVTSPPTVVTSPTTIITSPPTIVTSPATVVTTICALLRGDCSRDGVINSADVVCLINYLFKGGPPPDPLWVGDANRDGTINSADVVYLINYLFKEGPPPCS